MSCLTVLISGANIAGPALALWLNRRGMRLRNWIFSMAFLFTPLMKLTDRFATDIKLEDYSAGL